MRCIYRGTKLKADTKPHWPVSIAARDGCFALVSFTKATTSQILYHLGCPVPGGDFTISTRRFVESLGDPAAELNFGRVELSGKLAGHTVDNFVTDSNTDWLCTLE